MKKKLKHSRVLKEFLCLLSDCPISMGRQLKSKFTALFQSYQTPFFYNRFNQVSVCGMCWPENRFKN
jgi:hypothetical protein